MPVNPHAQTILVIDDDMGVQMFVTQVLRNEGYQVLAAADMEEALHVSDVCPTDIHLILTDIMLPTSNGMALAQALVAKRPGTPVLYMSGAGSDAIHAIQFEGAPIGEFLEKPFPPDMLVKRVRAVLLQAAAESGAEPVGRVSLVFRGSRSAPKLRCRVSTRKRRAMPAMQRNHLHAAGGSSPSYASQLHVDPSAAWPRPRLPVLRRDRFGRADDVLTSQRR